ncbi:MAG TPA: VWA domain-containing protein [Candidatus Acidoferrales bacterium]|jgi:VWFA-related protein|nr:VWA domain-containing protein [Candidatus Acidoferrales bacterium]
MILRGEFVLRLALALALGAALAAGAPSQAPQAPPTAPQHPIRVVTNEVVVPVTVTDASGEFVLDLLPSDFRIYDDGVEQRIDRWDLGDDPLAVVLVLQTSDRARSMIPAIHSLGSIFTETVMALDGEAAVVTYDSTVDVRQAFTKDHDAVENAIADAPFEDSSMHLYDAMATAVDLLKGEPTTRRRIMLIVGESRDDGSKASFGGVVRDAEHANITIYGIGPSSVTRDLLQDAPSLWAAPAIFLLQQGRNRSKNHDLEVAAAATGGAHYSAVRAETLRDTLDKIGGELHAQYILTYKPNAERAPGFHSIAVSVLRSDITVRARPGYFVAQTAN